MKIGERIRQARRHKDCTQEALGKALGVTREMVSQYESGDVVDYPLNRLESIAHYCAVNKCWLAFGIGDMVAEQRPELDMRAIGVIMDDVLTYVRKHNLRPPVSNIVEAVTYAYKHFVNKSGIERDKLRDMLKMVLH